MAPKQMQELCRTIAGGALFIGGFLCGGVFVDTPWWKAGLLAGMLLAGIGLWMMLYPPLKRWWKSDQTQTWGETGKTEAPSGKAPEDGKNEE